jgi:hypothetical protein
MMNMPGLPTELNVARTKTGIYSLTVEEKLGISATALYGNDTISLGLGDTPSLAGQNFGGIASEALFLGSFGLNPAATNFSALDTPVPSYISTLRAQNQIPSLSYAYTAGNQYQSNGVFGSLILGGYDASLLVPNDLTIEFNSQSEFDLTINVNAITMSSHDGIEILSLTPFPAFIDSTLPYLYLPIEVCAAFEAAFGIVYDNASGLYLVNDALHAKLLAQSANVTFTLTNATGNTVIDIVLPYQAFDLTAEWPLVANKTRYFPLKRALNNTQTILGRAFLQEVYLVADYERSNFSVYQRRYTDVTPDIRTILPAGDDSVTASRGRDVNIAATAGGSVGGAILVTLLVGCVLMIRRRSKRIAVLQSTDFTIEDQTPSLSRTISTTTIRKPELDASGRQETRQELDARPPRSRHLTPPLALNTNIAVRQVQGVHEMEANEPVMAEVAGSPVEIMLQQAIDDILQQRVISPKIASPPLRSMSYDHDMSEVVSPLSPEEFSYPGHNEQDIR